MVKEFKRGDIIRVDFGNGIGHVQGGIRPALVTQNDKGNYYSPVLIVVPITSQQKTKLPTHMDLDISCGLKRPSTAMFEQPTPIDKELQVLEYIGHIEMNRFTDIKILIAQGCLSFLGEKFRRMVCI